MVVRATTFRVPSSTLTESELVQTGDSSLVLVMVTVIVCAVECVLPASVAASTTTQVSELLPDPQPGFS